LGHFYPGVYNGASGAFLSQFNDEYNLGSPRGLRLGPGDNVYVSSIRPANGDPRVSIFTEADGRFVSALLPRGSMTDPWGLCFLPGSANDVNDNLIPDVCEAGDTDGDGFADYEDNCLAEFNETQADLDEDGVGDACDNCPSESNGDQRDFDEDGYGDVCDN
jgi:hypothetical protein